MALGGRTESTGDILNEVWGTQVLFGWGVCAQTPLGRGWWCYQCWSTLKSFMVPGASLATLFLFNALP